jgi:aspartyl-tRNA synthetase
MLRTHTCGELTNKQIGQEVTLAGWVQSRRDHGGIIFIDLRDRYGITQIVFDPKRAQEAWKMADTVRSEFVIRVVGNVVARPEEMVNPKLTTGTIEVDGRTIEILSTAKALPFEIGMSEASQANEELRLKYRFLDLRNPWLERIMEQRDQVITHVRSYMHEHQFIEVQTPILANSSPEGARDYLVPSRLHPGKFFALPQAPQQFKQLLMIAGLDRYFQIAPCFRDEDPRADRHAGDFYQIDLEMSFVEQEDVWDLVEPLMIELTEKFSEKNVLQQPFPRLSYHDCVETYGTDKPDLRFGFEIRNVSDLFRATSFTVFQKTLEEGGVVHGMKVDGGSAFSRKEIDELTALAQGQGLKGLAYLVVEKEELRSPIAKFLSETEKEQLVKQTHAKSGDILFFGAGAWSVVCKALGAVRDECGRRLNKKDSSKAAWLWVSDFPMYEETEGKIDFSHNPFSMPQGGMEALETKHPLEILAHQYDLVCNGYEMSSGAIRNHRPDIMYKAFEIAGYTKEEVDAKFGHMIRAFEYGAPPHGGIAPGLDRILMVLWECSSIRDIYAFPKNSSGQDVMLGAPSAVDEKQLRDLHIKLR